MKFGFGGISVNRKRGGGRRPRLGLYFHSRLTFEFIIIHLFHLFPAFNNRGRDVVGVIKAAAAESRDMTVG